jgi:hypothetical protein
MKGAVGAITMQEIAIAKAVCIGHRNPSDYPVGVLDEFSSYIVYDLACGVNGGTVVGGIVPNLVGKT